LNQFVARVEPDEQDERIHRSLADRYVSVRTDLDGVSSLNAALSSLDAAAIDRVLTAITAVADPGDTRTLQQRRADALVDVLLGRISNGCHTRCDGDEANTIGDEADEKRMRKRRAMTTKRTPTPTPISLPTMPAARPTIRAARPTMPAARPATPMPARMGNRPF